MSNIPDFTFDLVSGPTMTFVSGSISASAYLTSTGRFGFGIDKSTPSVDFSVNSVTSSYLPASGIDIFKTSQDGTGAGGVIIVEHFLAPTTALINTFATTVNGTGASVVIVPGLVGRPGIIQQSTGTTGSGRASTLSQATCILFGSGSYIYESEINLPILSTPSQRYTFYAGFGGISASGDMINGAYFQYTDASSNFWQIKTSTASVRTTTTTNSLVTAGTWYKLKIIVTDISTADFYINDIYVGSITTNMSSATGRETGIIVKIEKSNGSSPSTSLIDYIKVVYK